MLTLNDLFQGFRQPEVIRALAAQITELAKDLPEPLRVMEVCGGHTHTIMKYGLHQLLPASIEFVHGPGCPVCIMPKERIDQAIELASQPSVILVTLGDMIRVPGSRARWPSNGPRGAISARSMTPSMPCASPVRTRRKPWSSSPSVSRHLPP